MTYYHNPATNQIAKVLHLDPKTNIAIVVIDDKSRKMDWNEFLAKFNSLANKRDEITSKKK